MSARSAERSSLLGGNGVEKLIRYAATAGELTRAVLDTKAIDVVHFERTAGMSGAPPPSTFDIVFVLKGAGPSASSSPAFTTVEVPRVPRARLAMLKEWLEGKKLTVYEGVASLNWPNIIKAVNELGVKEFYEDGGWKFLSPLEDSDDEGDTAGAPPPRSSKKARR